MESELDRSVNYQGPFKISDVKDCILSPFILQNHMEQKENILYNERQAVKPDPQKIFHGLEGVWAFNRRISGYGGMDGTATFIRKDGDTLLYRETGLLKLDEGPVFESYRNYIYRWNGKRITVFFEDGRPFHELDFETNMLARGFHECGLDLYRAAYHFKNADGFRLEWTVTGPKKDYKIETEFKKRTLC
jgi:hypothetical protein